MVAVELPTALNHVLLAVGAFLALHVDTLHPTLHGVGVIDVARATATGLFRADDHPVGIGLATVLDIVLYDVVIAVDIYLFHHTETSAATVGIESGIVDGSGKIDHRTGNLLAFLVAFYPPFLVADAPEGYRRVVAMVSDHPFQ